MVKADLVFKNGKIATVDRDFSFKEAVAIKDGWIIAVGSDCDMAEFIGDGTEVIDLENKLMLPGAHDTHMHGVHTGLALSDDFIDVSYPKVKNLDDLRAILQQAASERQSGEWIMGMGWNNMLIEECAPSGRAPNKWDIDSVTPDNPVMLNDFGAHRLVVNSKALEICGIDENTPDLKPEEGFIERDPQTNEPTGYFNEWGAQLLISKHAPTLNKEQIKKCIRLMQQELNKNGITSHNDILGKGGDYLIAGSWGNKAIEAYEEMAHEGELTARVDINVLACVDGLQSYDSITAGLKDIELPEFADKNWVKADAIKVFGDGAAWLRENIPGTQMHGRSTFPGETDEEQRVELVKTLIEIHRQGWKVGIHAIGGKTIDASIEAFVTAQQMYPRQAPRHFLIHGDDMTRENAVLAGQYDIGLSVQSIAGYNILDFMGGMFEPERAKELFSLQEYTDLGVVCSNGSDSSIFPVNWRQGVQFAVTRKTINGNVYASERKSSLEQAIRMYTINGAYQQGLEHIKGSIEVNKLADLQVLEEDIFEIDPEKIGEIPVKMTICAGKIVYQS